MKLGNDGPSPERERRSTTDAWLCETLYKSLRTIARREIANERAGHTLSATALVNEAYVRLAKSTGRAGQPWQSQAHFVDAAINTMRRVLFDHAKAKGATKRGGGYQRIPLDALAGRSLTDPALVLDFDAVLQDLGTNHPEAARLVELRAYAGLGRDEAASLMQLPPRTIDRHWALARAWFRSRLEGTPP